jgi:hypothetical protein
MINTKFLGQILPDSIDICYLNRGNSYHSELGFVGYNLDRPEPREFIADYERQYSHDLFLQDDSWDDCHQFDYLVKRRKPQCHLIDHNSMAQPFDNSVLGKYMTHYKGARKPGGIAG